jgi:hypothetical protein
LQGKSVGISAGVSVGVSVPQIECIPTATPAVLRQRRELYAARTGNAAKKLKNVSS